MHNLTGKDFLSGIVRDLKMEHKELLYFLSLQKKLYQHLIQKRDAQAPLTINNHEYFLKQKGLTAEFEAPAHAQEHTHHHHP